MKTGINPVTIRTPGQPQVVISRMHVTLGTDPCKKMLTVLLLPEGAKDATGVLGMAILDEDKFIEALGHLFPGGELAKAHEE